MLVTRPAEQAAPLVAALSGLGAIPIVYPTITVGPPLSWELADDALGRLRDYGWAIFASPSAVAFTIARALAIGLTPRVFEGVRLAAVGTETARALAQHGLAVALVPAADEQRQEGLLAALLASLPPPGVASGTRILFPQALGGRELLRDELTGRGYVVDVVPVSRTVARELSAPPPRFDVATFASPSALRAFVEGLGRDRLLEALVAVIGPTTADAAASLGVRVDVVASSPSVASMVQSLVDLRSRRSPPVP